MQASRISMAILGAWVLLVGGYTLVSLFVPNGPSLQAFGNLSQCVIPLAANMGLLLNAGSSNWRRNTFWLLLAMGCSMWMIAQMIWTYYELVLGQHAPNPFAGDVVFFLHIVPMIGALALQPHLNRSDRGSRFGYLDFSVLLLWWIFLYVFTVIPWQYVAPNDTLYLKNYIELYLAENLVLIAGLGYLCLRTQGKWRLVYAHLCGAATLYLIASQATNMAIAEGRYQTGSLFDVPMVASFAWFGTAGAIAFAMPPDNRPAAPAGWDHWRTWLTMAAVLSMPLFGIYSLYLSPSPESVREFRLLATLVAILTIGSLVFIRQHLLDKERLALLGASQESFENLKRLQTQLVQSEKLASLGQLAAGAAHEINNPLTAILGYSELLIEDPASGSRQKDLAQKVRDQARRTKQLVTNLLSFARQMPAEKTLLDINAVVASAVQLRTLDLRGKSITIETNCEKLLPAVRGDQNQLLQVLFNIINNAVDALEEVGGGTLILRTYRHANSVVVECQDTGPGIKEPSLVFDPFYTTKPVGKGTGLGLSICYGLVQEHGGLIRCENHHEGGALFRVELPASIAVLPTAPGVLVGVGSRKPSE